MGLKAADKRQFVLFDVGKQRYAVGLEHVDCVLPAMRLTALPGAPPVIKGIFNLHGELVAVGDIRKRTGLPEIPIELSDQIVVVRNPGHMLGLLTEGPTEVATYPAGDITADDVVLRNSESVEGVIRLRSNLVLIQNVEKFLSLDEQVSLKNAAAAYV